MTRAHASSTSGDSLYDWLKQHSTSASSGKPQAARPGDAGRARCRSLGWYEHGICAIFSLKSAACASGVTTASPIT